MGRRGICRPLGPSQNPEPEAIRPDSASLSPLQKHLLVASVGLAFVVISTHLRAVKSCTDEMIFMLAVELFARSALCIL